MIDTLGLPLSLSLANFGATSRARERAVDESLFLEATARCQDSRQRLLELAANAPGVRACIRQWLEQTLNMNGDSVQFHFFATGTTPERYVTLTQACAFIQHSPALGVSLNQQCQVIGLQSQKHYATRPLELIRQIKKFSLRQALGSRWVAYWFGRARGTAMSRHDLAKDLYRGHLQAAGQLACATGAISPDQLKPLLALIDPPAGELQVEGQKIYVEKPLLKYPRRTYVELPGALVITLDAETSLQLLYVPSSPSSLMSFNDRSRMERWLLDQSGLFPGVTHTTDDHFIGYEMLEKPLHLTITQLLAHWLNEKLESVRSDTGASSDFAEQGGRALEVSDGVDRQHRDQAFFAVTPGLPGAPLIDDDSSETAPIAFSGLTADQPLSLRRRNVKQQQDAMAALLEPDAQGEQDAPRLLTLSTSLDALHQAQHDAGKAASSLFSQQPVIKLLELQQHINPDYSALYQARLQGLIHEADIQRQLGQINDHEHNLLMVLLDASKATWPQVQVRACTLTLATTEQTNGQRVTTSNELYGVLLISQAGTAQNTTTPDSLLLYWPGTTGGLQRFDNLQALEHWLRVTPTGDLTTTLEQRLLGPDAFDYSLQMQLYGCVQHIGELFGRTSAAQDAPQQVTELDKIRLQALHDLGVPTHSARELAHSRLLEQNQSGALARQLPEWLGHVLPADKIRLKDRVEAYLQAFQQASALQDLHLPLSSTFCKQRLDARLTRELSLQHPFSVQIDLPESVSQQQHSFPAPGAPGTPTRTVWVPSATRVSLSLEELALANIDSPLTERLAFMQVHVTSKNPSERETLAATITSAYLRTLIPELNLAQHYTDLIHTTYMGSNSEAVFVREHRLECLSEPYRLMLQIQGQLAFAQKALTHDELQRFNVAIDARTPQAWQAGGDTLQLLPAFLSAGGKDTGDGPSTLSGITFIHLKSAGQTLLYLPESPDGRHLRRFDSLEAARMALFNACLDSAMVNYLAQRALLGDVESHVSRINQALRNNFNAMIGVGAPWPATTSLANHLMHAQMGRLVQAHRATSRSNSELYLERYALQGEQVFNYIKMAIGVVPILGTVVGLYDAWTGANQAVDAFRRGDHVQGMQDISMILLSLIDAGIDVVSGVVVTPGAARTRTVARQLGNGRKSAGYVQPPLLQKSRHINERFEGYEYSKEIALGHLQPATHGLYRGIYRHADGDFIVRQGRVYQVRLQDGRWRLSGNAQKLYKQPIALDETGQWDTHFGVYGALQHGGLAGGGGVLGHLADRLEPLWPLAIRERLPRWWTDNVFRRQQAINSKVDSLGDQLDGQLAATGNLQRASNQSDLATREALLSTLEKSYTKDINLALEHSSALDELLPLTPARNQLSLKGMQSRNAWIITNRYQEKLRIGARRLESLTEKYGINPPSTAQHEAFFGYLQTRKSDSLEILRELEGLETALTRMNEWNDSISLRAQEAEIRSKGRSARKTSEQINQDVHDTFEQIKDLRKDMTAWNDLYSPEFRQHLRTTHSIETFNRYDDLLDPSWLYLQEQINSAFKQVHRAMQNHYSLATTSITASQRTRILNECIQAYTHFSLNVKTLSAGYPRHFDLPNLPPLLKDLDNMSRLARKHLSSSQPRVRQKPAGESRKVFETEDSRLLIGTESTAPGTGAKRYSIENVNGRTETWEQKADGKARLQEVPSSPLPTARNAKAVMLTEARSRLQGVDAYQAKVEGYARQGMLPVDLEHMMVSEAAELTQRSYRIERLDAEEALIGQLRDRARELTTTGRALRTRESLASPKPTDGMLDDLARQRVVEVRRTSDIQSLGKRADGRSDYLQEYEVWDLTATPQKLVWYAHFHYSRAEPLFADFEKAHLKLPQHRFMTHADDPNLPYADIGKRSAALVHFPLA